MEATPLPLAPFGALSDLLAGEDAYRGSERHDADAAYWRSLLADRPEPGTLAAAEPALPRALTSGSTALPPEAAAELRAAAADAGASWPAVVLAAVALYLSRLTGQDDVVLGLPVTARRTAAERSVPAMVSNVVPLRIAPRPGLTVRELVRHTSERLHAALRHQRYRLEELRRDLGLLADGARLLGPYVNLVPLENTLRFGAATCTVRNLAGGPVDDFALVLDGRAGGGLRLQLDANADLYTPADVDAHLARLAALIRQLAEAPDRLVGRVGLVEPAELARLATWNDTSRPVPPATLPALLERQAARTPDAPAVVAGDETLTYAELHGRANALARLLVRHGARPEQYVALLLPRGADMIVALLAVLKSGAAYLPLDPDYPPARLAAMVADAAPPLVVTTSEAASVLETPADGPLTLVLDSPAVQGELAGLAQSDLTDADRAEPLLPGSPAYVIYTSGSTGRPKGVVVAQQSVVDMAAWAVDAFGPDRLARVLASTSLCFDVSVFEMFGPLACGGSIEVVRNVLALAEQPGRHWDVTLVSAVPSAFAQVLAAGAVDAAPGSVVLAGEALSAHAVREISAALPGAELANIYGPTEATVYATAWYASPGTAEGAPPIGGPLENTRTYVLDAHLRQVPPGTAGELYLAGTG
ncbi:AMP-binding protein, partial [Motilibacter deserti]|nr:AMP-binding protein [Motilibacter deserti]